MREVLIHAEVSAAICRAGRHEPVVAGTTRLSYRQLADEVERTARGLHALGVRRGDKVAVLMGNRAEWVISPLAITSIGAVLVAVNARSTAHELGYVLDHADASALILTPTYPRYDYRAMLAGQALPKLRNAQGLRSAAASRCSAWWTWVRGTSAMFMA